MLELLDKISGLIVSNMRASATGSYPATSITKSFIYKLIEIIFKIQVEVSYLIKYLDF